LAWNASAILSSSSVYDVFQSLVGAPKIHRTLLAEYVQPQSGDHLLDIGCGVGATLSYLSPNVRYTGIDISSSYIQRARARFGDRGIFVCSDISDVELGENCFDCAIACGVMHHLSDSAAQSLLRIARSALRPGKRLITIDPCYTPDQPKLVRYVISKDRGRFVRDEAGYRRLFDTYGTSELTIVDDLLHFPYTHIIGRIGFEK
jgi:cyclopropane fatty-acyl-phospholipid synthase-like methyltransferase